MSRFFREIFDRETCKERTYIAIPFIYTLILIPKAWRMNSNILLQWDERKCEWHNREAVIISSHTHTRHNAARLIITPAETWAAWPCFASCLSHASPCGSALSSLPHYHYSGTPPQHTQWAIHPHCECNLSETSNSPSFTCFSYVLLIYLLSPD